jgi:hypothetical protein
MGQIQLQNGDYVNISGVDHETRMRLKDGLEEASSGREWTDLIGIDNYLGLDVRDGSVYSHPAFIRRAFTGRELTVSQVLGEEEAQEPEIDCSRPQDYEYHGSEIVHIWDSGMLDGEHCRYLIASPFGSGFNTYWADACEIKKRPKLQLIPGKWYEVSDKEDFSGPFNAEVFHTLRADGEFVSNAGVSWSYFRPIPKGMRSQFVFEGDEQ